MTPTMTAPRGPVRSACRWAALVGWSAALVAAAGLLVRMGHGALGPPPVTSLAALRRWEAARDAPTLVMSVLRLVSLCLNGYLLLTTVAGAVARGARCAAAVMALDLVTPASVRRLLTASVGGIVLSAPLAAPGTTGAAWPRVAGAPATTAATWTALANGPARPLGQQAIVLAPVAQGPPLVRISPPSGASAEPPAAPGLPTATPPPAQPTTAPTLGPTRPGAGAPASAASDARPAAAPSATAPFGTAPSGTAPSGTAPPAIALPPNEAPPQPEWTVLPGQNLWVIAGRLVAARTGVATPRAADIAPVWAELIAVNRARLRDPANPSLIYAGQQFVIPPR
jgi:hypothetical protein